MPVNWLAAAIQRRVLDRPGFISKGNPAPTAGTSGHRGEIRLPPDGTIPASVPRKRRPPYAVTGRTVSLGHGA